jgi:CelD/BcsL family acetyltransferase involved in cellulose biosynthesis
MIEGLERATALTSADAGAITTELLVGTDAFLVLEQEWSSLFERSGTQNPFLCWEWMSTWARHFCGERLRTVVIWRDDQVIAIAPMHLNRYLIGPGMHCRALQLLGPKEVQHLFEMRQLLVLPGLEEVALQAVLDRVQKLSGWDWIELSAEGAGIVALQELASSIEGNGFDVVLEPVTQIPVMALEATWDLQRQKLKRNIKESIRHCYNALRRDGHNHVFAAGGSVEQLLELHRRRSLVQEHRQHRDSFAEAATRSFEADVLSRMQSAGRARIVELAIDGEVVAARACLEAHGALYLYYSGFDPSWWKYSVLTLLVTEAIRDAIDRGMKTVNFSPGTDNSKSRWGVDLVPMQTVTLVRSNPVSRARHGLLRIRKKIRQPLHRQLERVLGLFARRQAREA